MKEVWQVTLQEFFTEHPKVALGFSGGVDSSYLLYAAAKYGADVRPYFIRTEFQPEFELEDARSIADQVGVGLTVIEHDILSSEAVAENPTDRCYHCKSVLFGLLKERAVSDGYTTLIDGTNASDDAGDRPGMRALKEMDVRSPLRECGLTKSDIRRLSKEAGLFTYDKPAYACLATRIPAGTRLTADMLERVECAEGELFKMGFSDFRVRVYHDAARLQFRDADMTDAIMRREEIRNRLAPWFEIVMLDLKGRG